MTGRTGPTGMTGFTGPTGPIGIGLPLGNNYGEYPYWNGTQWVVGNTSIRIGQNAGRYNQGANAVAIGYNAGTTGQGANSININSSGLQDVSGQSTNTIIINASNTSINGNISNAIYIAPIRNASAANTVYYNSTTNELTYNASSKDYKTNIINLSQNTANLYNLQTREYDYIDGEHCVGLIAEEVNIIDNNLTIKENGLPVNINWFALQTYMLKEIQILKEENIKLSNRIKTLENKNT